jgi:hypothetical protein
VPRATPSLLGAAAFGSMLVIGTTVAAIASLPGHCDPKFGCLGTFKLTVFIHAAAGLITAIATTSIAYSTQKLWRTSHTRKYLAVIIAAALLGSGLTFYIRYNPMSDDWSMFLGWLGLSGLVAGTALWLASASRHNKSLERSRER